MPARRVTINGREQIDPRHTRAWRVLVADVIKDEPTCWLQLDGCTQVSTTGDHVIAVTERPELALVRSNVRGACWPCNDKRGNLGASELRLGGQAERPAALSVFD